MPKYVPRAGALRMTNLFTLDIAEIAISYSTNVKPGDRVKITTSKTAYEVFAAGWPSYEHREYFYIILMNRANKVLGISQISVGGISGTVVDPKLVFQAALKANASSIILGHNHPSGELIPSDADNALTRKLADVGALLDLPVLDHLIMNGETYYSYKDEGKL